MMAAEKLCERCGQQPFTRDDNLCLDCGARQEQKINRDGAQQQRWKRPRRSRRRAHAHK